MKLKVRAVAIGSLGHILPCCHFSEQRTAEIHIAMDAVGMPPKRAMNQRQAGLPLPLLLSAWLAFFFFEEEWRLPSTTLCSIRNTMLDFDILLLFRMLEKYDDHTNALLLAAACARDVVFFFLSAIQIRSRKGMNTLSN